MWLETAIAILVTPGLVVGWVFVLAAAQRSRGGGDGTSGRDESRQCGNCTCAMLGVTGDDESR
jgi:hypothetical protein